MKRLTVALLSLALVAAACGDDDAVDAASLDSCEGLAAAGIALLQDTIDLIDGLDEAALAALGDEAGPPPEFVALQTRGDEMSARADEVGCSDEEMAALLAERASGLSADSIFGQFILEGVRAGESGDFFGG
jgi:hypothetical protein